MSETLPLPGPDDERPPQWNVPKVGGRFPLFASEEITVEDLRQACNNAGLHLHADIEGRWVIERVHAIALVKKDKRPANEPGEPCEDRR